MTRAAFWFCALGMVACSGDEPVASIPYTSDFSGSLGKEWSSRGGGWQTVDGRLFNDGARNVPLWLSAALPSDVRVSFTAESQSDAVDIKCEIFGNGVDHQSGYVVILSGWNNSTSIIARLDEHGAERTRQITARLTEEVARDAKAARTAHRDRRERLSRAYASKRGQLYRFRIERKSHRLSFYVDDALHLDYFDPSPLGGRGHDRFAFSNWASRVFFDDLKIERLTP